MYIYAFHMPLFLFVSGLFSKKNIEQKRYKNIFSFLTLYLFIKIVTAVTKAVIYHKISIELFSEHGAPWYAFAVFIFLLVTILVRNTSKIYVFVFSVILALISGYDSSIGSFLSLSRIITYYPFFFAGYCFNVDEISEFLSKKYIKIISAVILIIPAVILFFKTDSIYWLRPLLTNSMSYNALKSARAYGAVYRLIYYIVAFLMSGAVISLTPNKTPKGYIAKLGSRSVQVYSLHYIFIYFLYDFLGSHSYIATHTWVIFPLAIITTLFFSMKFFEPLFNIILNPKGIKSND